MTERSGPVLVTFTNLFPSAKRPTHGLFVRERMRRVAAEVADTFTEWRVVVPVPRVPALLRRRGGDKLLASLPAVEEVPLGAEEGAGTVTVHHVHYMHLPGMSLHAQAKRIVAACRPLLSELLGNGGVIDAHYVYPDGVAALTLARELDVPCFVTARGSDINVLADDRGVRKQIAAVGGSAEGLWTVSETLQRRFAQVANVPDDRVEVVRNGVDLERFKPGDKLDARRELGLPDRAALILGVGRLVASKGFDTIVKALRELPDLAHAVFVGDGPMRAELEADETLQGRLHLLGAQPPDRVALAMQACDVLAFPSHREGWPNVVTETLASGRPVVATPVGSVPVMLSSPFVGAMVRVGDHVALARELGRVLSGLPDPAVVRRHAEQFGWSEPIAFIAERFRAALRPREVAR